MNLRKWIEDSDRLCDKEVNRVKWLIGNKTDNPREVSQGSLSLLLLLLFIVIRTLLFFPSSSASLFLI